MNVLNRGVALAVGLVVHGAPGQAQDIDAVFVPISSSETVTAPLNVGGVLTSQAYTGLVRLDASGFGTNNIEATDSYYTFERPLGQPVTPFAPVDGSWLAVGEESGGECLDFGNPLADPVSNLTVFIDDVGTVNPGPGTIPGFASNHVYSVVIDLGGYAGRLYVGNRDCGFFDNSGELVVTLTMVERECNGDGDCGDGNPCTDEICDLDFGCVVTDNSDPCDDGDACTQRDTCQEGACIGSDPVVCTPLDQCHEAGTCQPETGTCSAPEKPDGTSCDDGDLCTQTDTCHTGACIGSEPVSCTASDQCHDAGTCDPMSGVCSNPEKPNGATCDDGAVCTANDRCTAGTCEGGVPTLQQPLENPIQTVQCLLQTLPLP